MGVECPSIVVVGGLKMGAAKFASKLRADRENTITFYLRVSLELFVLRVADFQVAFVFPMWNLTCKIISTMLLVVPSTPQAVQLLGKSLRKSVLTAQSESSRVFWNFPIYWTYF